MVLFRDRLDKEEGRAISCCHLGATLETNIREQSIQLEDEQSFHNHRTVLGSFQAWICKQSPLLVFKTNFGTKFGKEDKKKVRGFSVACLQ